MYKASSWFLGFSNQYFSNIVPKDIIAQNNFRCPMNNVIYRVNKCNYVIESWKSIKFVFIDKIFNIKSIFGTWLQKFFIIKKIIVLSKPINYH